MSLNDLPEIVNKYSITKPDEAKAIQKDFSDIVSQLRYIKRHISFRLREMVDSDNIDDEKENELLQDSKLIRNYINTISHISKSFNVIDVDRHQIKGQLSLFEYINLYLCYDDICPLCNWKMNEVIIQYKQTKNDSQHNLSAYQCASCSRLFVMDYDLDDINIENSNITLHYDYAIKNELDITDVIVLSSVTRCISIGHNITDVEAKIPVINKDGSIEYIDKNIAYCRECQNYIMLKSDFKDIESIVACQVIDQTISYTPSSNYDDIESEQKQSILYQYGYNVSNKNNLSSKQRHYILAMVIESGILTKSEVLSHLDTLIERGSKIPKWSDATSKWKQDRHYVTKYNKDNLPEILVNKIIKKYHRTNLDS